MYEVGSGRRRCFHRKLLRRVGRSQGGHDGFDNLLWHAALIALRTWQDGRECHSRPADDLIVRLVA